MLSIKQLKMLLILNRKFSLELAPKYWNQFENTTRTNNNIEGFHSGLNKFINSKHPNIYRLVKQLAVIHNSSSINYLAAKYNAIILTRI